MKTINPNAFYTPDHEWIYESQGNYYIGISEFAQELFGQIKFVELALPDSICTSEKPYANLESNKSTYELFLPFDGVILGYNQAILDQPALINSAPYKSWLVCFNGPSQEEISKLMSSQDYLDYIGVFFNKIK